MNVSRRNQRLFPTGISDPGYNMPALRFHRRA
jgi:hypothetical protein